MWAGRLALAVALATQTLFAWSVLAGSGRRCSGTTRPIRPCSAAGCSSTSFLAVTATAGLLLAAHPRQLARQGAPFALAALGALPLLVLFGVPAQGRAFPVANTRANNVPMLSQRNQARLVHRFHSPAPGLAGPPLLALERKQPRARLR